MDIMIRPRGAGKTTELINRVEKSGGYIVCENMERASVIAQMAEELGKEINYPLTFNEFLGKKYHPAGVSKVCIDNADRLLQSIAIGVEVTAITMTQDEP